MKKIAILACEPSGDLLGASLIESIKKRNPDLFFYGIGGSNMTKHNFQNLVSMEFLSVMGIKDVLKQYLFLHQLNKRVIRYFIDNPPDIFIGIDSPDFNLPIGKALKSRGIKTVQYVSPKVWAWRENRVHKIKQSVDKILCLFPFEVAFYNRFNVNAEFIGHPLADKITLEPNTAQARCKLGIDTNAKVICVLPGSRQCELKHMIPLLSKVIENLSLFDNKLIFLVPLLNNQMISKFKTHLTQRNINIKIRFIVGRSQLAIESADLVITKAGTATLESLLFKKPMIVCFKTDPLTYHVIRHLATVKHIALPNLLANKLIVSEFIQKEARIENIVNATIALLKSRTDYFIEEYYSIHKALKANASEKASHAIMSLI